jgi:hypothetical protein
MNTEKEGKFAISYFFLQPANLHLNGLTYLSTVIFAF